MGHVCAHGHAALAQAPYRPGPWISVVDLSCLVRGPARRRRMAATVQGRHQGLAGLPAVGARHGWCCRRERHGGHRSRSRPDGRARRSARTSRARDHLRAQGCSGRRPRRLRRPAPAGLSIVGSQAGAGDRPSVPLVGHNRFRALQGRQDRRARRQRLSLRQCRRCPGGGGRRGAPVRAATASAADQQVERDRVSRILPGLSRPRRRGAMADLHLHLLRRRAAAARVRCCVATAMRDSPSGSTSPGST